VAEDEAAKKIASIPLERFAGALNLLRDHPQINADRVAGMAVSRGAEGLLAAICRIDDLICRGLILISPSSVTWQAIGSEGEVPDTPSWTWAGGPVPWLALPTGELMSQLIRNAWRIGRDTANHQPTLLRLRPAYEAGLQKRSSALGEASIAAERASCPLLLLTGGDDDVWPSEQMAKALLGRRGSSVGDQHHHYTGAGHLIRLGIFPTDAQWTNGISFGGTREGQAAVQRDATGRVLSFLKALLCA
jgi:pimeloyl-ACP methyl ester carboxylesterase